ncbi:MAG TPA: STAS domain-containing protein [Terriglobales bacterium]|jgi:anti-anti-sigma factor|nr:STAS domain-containing protein [Terriglobales bacterium]
MKPEDPVVSLGPGIARTPATDDKTSDKRLQLTLEAGQIGSAVVLHCQGRIIFHSEAQAISAIVAEVLPSAARMVVDLSGIDLIDSGGLGELVLIHMWAEAAGHKLKFASPRKSLRNLFEITNLVSVLDVYGSVPEAMTAMVQEEIHSS